MPELPDVEIFKRYLDATALNQKIARVSVKNTKVLRHIAPQTLVRNLKGRTLRSSLRHGKFLFGQLDKDGSVIFHFGMTGFLTYFKDKAKEPKHTRVRMDFSNGSFLGYVYSDEILFQARVHPEDRVDRLSQRILKKVYQVMRTVLNKTIRYHAGPEQVPKGWLLPHRAKGAKCPRCGTGLNRLPIRQRSAYVCQNCQRRSG
jgi:formamidopyrimidine-DNA glycosylase